MLLFHRYTNLVLTFVFLLLSSFLQVRRIKQFRAQMSMARSRSSNTLSTDGSKTITGNLIHTAPPSPTGLRQRISSVVLGVKGSMLTPRSSLTDLRLGKDREFKQQNPVARLKLLLVCCVDFIFLGICPSYVAIWRFILRGATKG